MVTYTTTKGVRAKLSKGGEVMAITDGLYEIAKIHEDIMINLGFIKEANQTETNH